MIEQTQPLSNRFASLSEQVFVAASGAIGGLSLLMNLVNLSII